LALASAPKTLKKELNTLIFIGALVLARTAGTAPPKTVAPIAPTPAMKAQR
jgi:hypothetical protein